MTEFEHAFTNLPEENEYPKLIRDRIPEIVRVETGRIVPVEALDDTGFEYRLRRKVIEEAAELAEAESDPHLLEEIADVQEVLDELARLKGFTPQQIHAVQDEKREKRGGFNDRLLMLSNDPKS